MDVNIDVSLYHYFVAGHTEVFLKLILTIEVKKSIDEASSDFGDIFANRTQFIYNEFLFLI